jgi:hypothetical protein
MKSIKLGTKPDYMEQMWSIIFSSLHPVVVSNVCGSPLVSRLCVSSSCRLLVLITTPAEQYSTVHLGKPFTVCDVANLVPQYQVLSMYHTSYFHFYFGSCMVKMVLSTWSFRCYFILPDCAVRSLNHFWLESFVVVHIFSQLLHLLGGSRNQAIMQSLWRQRLCERNFRRIAPYRAKNIFGTDWALILLNQIWWYNEGTITVTVLE